MSVVRRRDNCGGLTSQPLTEEEIRPLTIIAVAHLTTLEWEHANAAASLYRAGLFVDLIQGRQIVERLESAEEACPHRPRWQAQRAAVQLVLNLRLGPRHEVVVEGRHARPDDVQVPLPPQLALALLRRQLLVLVGRQELLEGPRPLLLRSIDVRFLLITKVRGVSRRRLQLVV